MPNLFLDERSARDIDGAVGRLLSDLGSPEPPLDLDNVRDLLRLDLHYYSLRDPGVLQQTVHQLKMAGKLVIERPSRIFDLVRTLDLKALLVPDRRQILIDADLPDPKKRWAEAHEVCHDVIPWHELVAHGDQQQLLLVDCQNRVEAEANFGAGRLLFFRDLFQEHLLGSPVTFDRVRALAGDFGNTMTSALWRTVETLGNAAFGLVSQHPAFTVNPDEPPVRHLLRSRRFEGEFGAATAETLFSAVRMLCAPRRGGPLGSGPIVLIDDNGAAHRFHAETFYNGHAALTLGLHQEAIPVAVSVPGTYEA